MDIMGNLLSRLDFEWVWGFALLRFAEGRFRFLSFSSGISVFMLRVGFLVEFFQTQDDVIV